ncbi:MAG: VanZ family protein [Betaproteobacteria bacterium]
MRVLYVASGWLLAAIIVWLSLTPAPPRIDFEQGDKLGHFLAYGSLMFWFCLLYGRRASRVAYGLLWIGMGVGLEFIQGQLGYRTYEVYDMYANALGVLIGWAISFAIPVRIAQKLR